LIDQVGQMLAQSRKKILVSYADLLAQGGERIIAQRTREIVWRDLLIITGSDP
jgi:hypothetical protein